MHGHTVRLLCDDGYMLPWRDGALTTDQFSCDDTGQWTPYDVIPSCVGTCHVSVRMLSGLYEPLLLEISAAL